MQRKTDPGNRLRINGIVKEIRKSFRGKMKTQMDIYIEANYVESSEVEWEEVIISDEDEKKIKEMASDPEIYTKIIKSIAPSIYGMDEIKEAVGLQLFGGVRHILPDRTKIRGDIHILLIGDPSTGKSQLLKLISDIIPRGKYVGGRGASAAGLTATVVKDEEFGGGWMLEAGAMVLANRVSSRSTSLTR
jgi:replicative DNA helicase Mcm